jgi:hypothetical protein
VLLAAVGSVILVTGLTGPAAALYLDSDRTLELSGKAQSRVSLRLQDADGFTYPDVTTGDMVQWRNLLLIEFNHDLAQLMDKTDLLYPFRALKTRVRYHLVGRFLYDGVYDVGPEVLRQVQDMDEDNIDDFKQSYELWEYYVDVSRGPLFFRIGRQNLSWGETDIFRLLDNINPLDNTFGGPFEDLDDRRIPLVMIRASYNFGSVGPVSSCTLESFWVPGFWDAHVAPWAPRGTPYAPPMPDLPFAQRFVYPDKTMDNSRWGFRVSGLLGNNLNFSLAHYKTFLDTPAVRLGVTPGLPALLNFSDAWQELIYKDVQITGASLNYCEPRTDIIFRGEVAWFWDEPILIPDENLKLSDQEIPLPPWAISLMSRIMGINLVDLNFTGIPLNPTGGTVPTKDILRYMIGLDKFLWIRPLNAINTFFVSLQYFGQWVPDYDPRMRQPLSIYPHPMDFAAVRETESTITAITNTSYLNGRLTPQLALAYDVRGAWLIQPSLAVLYEPFRFTIQYSAIEGAFTNFGAFRDRDQISFTFSYLLN